MKKFRPIYLKFAFITLFLLLIFLGNISPSFAFEGEYSFREYIFGINQEEAMVTFAPKFIKVLRGDEIKIYTTNSSTPMNALEENGYSISYDSKIYTYYEDLLPNYSAIQIIKLRTETEIRNVEILFSTRVFDSWQYSLGEKVVEQKGVLGMKEQEIQSFYEDGVLVGEEILSEQIIRSTVEEVIALGSSTYTLTGITQRGYDCEYWKGEVDRGNYSAKEKQWLKFVMYCESGCNAESNKSFYKGLFQWSPTLWKKLYPENIYDGHAQIKHTVEKLRAGANPLRMWPACTKKYESRYGSF